MRYPATLSLTLCLVLVGCNKPTGPVVVLDGWWTADYAKEVCRSAGAWYKDNVAYISQFGCERITACPEMMITVKACASDPVQDARRFENDLVTQFAANAECSAVQFVNFRNPDENDPAVSNAMKGPYWFLILDYKPGAPKQQWTMQRNPGFTSTQGAGNPKEIAKRACFIANEQGAKLAN
jgi:hypothetical protein